MFGHSDLDPSRGHQRQCHQHQLYKCNTTPTLIDSTLPTPQVLGPVTHGSAIVSVGFLPHCSSRYLVHGFTSYLRTLTVLSFTLTTISGVSRLQGLSSRLLLPTVHRYPCSSYGRNCTLTYYRNPLSSKPKSGSPTLLRDFLKPLYLLD